MGWLDFVESNRISYRRGSSGENVEIKCPLCLDDHSMHMGLSLKNSNWGCWRDTDHRGRNPAKLIQKVLGCTWDEAKLEASNYFQVSFVKPILEKPAIVQNAPIIKPMDFMPFGTDPDLEAQFTNYLDSRDLDSKYITNRYNLHWSVSGTYAYRVIFPIIQDKKWYSWTARSISPDVEVRYLAAKSSDCPNKVNEFIYDYDNLTGGSVLVICEGILDAMKVASTFIPGLHTTALQGKIIREKQLLQLTEVAKKYKTVLLGLDKDATMDAYKIKSQINLYLPNLQVTTPNAKDWGSLTKKEIKGHFLPYVR